MALVTKMSALSEPESLRALAAHFRMSGAPDHFGFADHLSDAADEIESLRTQLSTRGIVLPGWTCASCLCFNSAAKEWLKECRACGETGPAQP